MQLKCKVSKCFATSSGCDGQKKAWKGEGGLKTLSHAIAAAAAAAAVKLKAINVPHRQTDIQQRQRQPHSNRQEVK